MNKWVAICAATVVTWTAHGQDLERIAPKPMPAREAPRVVPPSAGQPLGSDQVLLPKLRALVFSAPQPTMPAAPGTGIYAEGLLAGKAAREKLWKYIGRPFSFRTLGEIQREVIAIYREHDLPLVDVVAPEQDITTGAVWLVVTEAKVGKVHAEGNHWVSSRGLEQALREQSGSVIRQGRLEADLARINTPFRTVNAVYAAGAEPGTTDITLETQDRFPLRTYIGYEDSGPDITGRDRWLAGFNCADALFLGAQLSYQFTTSDDFRSTLAHSVTYSIPLPWGHTLSFIGAIANSETDEPGLRLLGQSEQASVRYTMPLPAYGDFFAGFDWKQTDSGLDFGIAETHTPTDIEQFVFGYDCTENDSLGGTTVSPTLFYSPGDLAGHNSNADFREARALSRSNYFYTRTELDRVTRLPWNFTLATKLEGQLSSANLLPSEQFGIGGYDTVRGYDEHAAIGDYGLLVSNEMRAPAFSVLPKHRDQLQLLAFIDYGLVHNKHLLPGEPTSEGLCGAGIGLRYSISRYVSVRADYGWQLTRPQIVTGEPSRVHIGVMISY